MEAVMASDDLYRIRPLVWDDREDLSQAHDKLAGAGINVVATEDGRWNAMYREIFATRDEAKAAAEKWYRERLLTALEKVDE
jgi:hypothetical protein